MNVQEILLFKSTTTKIETKHLNIKRYDPDIYIHHKRTK